jgi:RimJ/RimL family protein N-acetyltransferase
MQLETGQQLMDWVRERFDYSPFPDARAIGTIVDGHTRGVAIYDRFEACDCHMHMFSDGSRRWVNREALYTMFAYPFLQCGLRRVTGRIGAKNSQSLRVARSLGFVEEGVCTDALPDDDVIILGLLRKECRFLSGPYLKAMETRYVERR